MVILFESYIQHRLSSLRWPASEAASPEIPSIVQPSPQRAYTRYVNMSKPGRLKWAASHLPAIAMPTDVATPCPSGPVVVSTPEVHRYSGWPGHLLSSWRNFLISSSGTDGSPRTSYCE